MAQVGLKTFEEALKADEALRQRYEEALKDAVETSSGVEVIQGVAAELGFELSLEELEQALAACQELDDSELESVAGGGDIDYEFCTIAYYCVVFFLHHM